LKSATSSRDKFSSISSATGVSGITASVFLAKISMGLAIGVAIGVLGIESNAISGQYQGVIDNYSGVNSNFKSEEGGVFVDIFHQNGTHIEMFYSATTGDQLGSVIWFYDSND